jgi:hypothetical protein
MIVPKYWAEAVARDRKDGRQITMRRFGWSNLNVTDSQTMADQRAAEALQRALAGAAVPRREPKVAYNGADGVPIREEIIEEHGDTVITRNSYGPLCLNTPDVLFADVDFDQASVPAFGAYPMPVAVGAIVLLSLAVLAWFQILPPVIAFSALLCTMLGLVLFDRRTKALLKIRIEERRQTAEKKARLQISAIGATKPDWKLRVYRTPAGLRVLVMHRLFSPVDAEAAELFKALDCDPIYVKMCRQQRCFRARVSPKPWRIGIGQHLLPKPGVWPIRSEAMPRRKAWVENYDKKAAAFASCRFESEIGRGVAHEKALAVQRLHDRLCAADSGKPIA